MSTVHREPEGHGSASPGGVGTGDNGSNPPVRPDINSRGTGGNPPGRPDTRDRDDGRRKLDINIDGHFELRLYISPKLLRWIAGTSTFMGSGAWYLITH
ncbi:hypothetical protein [Streptomyces sp. KR80]|uniref:hypothetical protein n=1 Tax=Streptomyces sp. KR80 TaxID=3457426 RepID=UPI003FD4474D